MIDVILWKKRWLFRNEPKISLPESIYTTKGEVHSMILMHTFTNTGNEEDMERCA